MSAAITMMGLCNEFQCKSGIEANLHEVELRFMCSKPASEACPLFSPLVLFSLQWGQQNTLRGSGTHRQAGACDSPLLPLQHDQHITSTDA